MPKLVRPKKPAQTKSTSPSKKNKQAKSDLEGLQRKPKREKKPRWDSTTSDLNVHKLSNLDLEVRHQSRKSKNIEIARHELYDKAKGSYGLESSGNMRPSPSDSASLKRVRARKQMAIRQSLHGKQELHNVLAKSDRTMRVVKDLFGDDPKRYSCQPNVTVAPHVKENKQFLEQAISESRLDGPPPTAQVSPGGIRDQNVREMAVRKPALNEFPNVCEALSCDGSERDMTPTLHSHPGPASVNIHNGSKPAPYKPGLNLDRFQELVKDHTPNEDSVSHGRAGVQSDAGSIGGLSEMSSIPLDSCLAEERRSGEDVTVDSDMTGVPYVQAHTKFPPHGVVANQQQSNFYNQQQHILPTQQEHVEQQHRFPDQQQQHKFSDQQRSFPDQQQHSFSDHSLSSQSSQPRVLPDHPLHVSRSMMKKQAVNSETGRVTASSSSEQIHTDLTLLGKFIGELEQELNGYEESIASGSTSHAHPTAEPRPPPGHDSWSETLGALLVCMRRMMQYLLQSEVQLKGEVAIRGQFLQALHEQQDLMDVLTADLMSLRKENMSLRQDVIDAKKRTSEEIATLKVEMVGMHTAISGLRQNAPGTQAATMLPSHISGQGGVGALWSPPNLSMDNTFMSDFTQLSAETAPGGAPPIIEGQRDVAKSEGLVYAQVTPLSHGSWSKSWKGLESNSRLAVHPQLQQRGVEDPSSITKQTSISSTTISSASSATKLPPTSDITLSSKATSSPTTKLPMTTPSLFKPPPKAHPPQPPKTRVDSHPPQPPPMAHVDAHPPQPPPMAHVDAHPQQPPPKTHVANAHPPQPPPSMGPLHSETSPRAGSHDFLGNLHAPAPPPLSVALQVPKSQLAPSTSLGATSLGARPRDGRQTADTAYFTSLSRQDHSVQDTHQTHTPLTATSVPFQQTPPPPPPLPAAAMDASDVTLNSTLSSGARPEYGYASGVGPKGGVSKPATLSLDTTLRDGDDSVVFDVDRLLESLQQLNKTQHKLQATAKKLHSLPVEPSQDLLQTSLPLAASVSSESVDDIKPSVSDFNHFSAGGGGDGGRLFEGADLSPQHSLSLPGECLQESTDMPDQQTGKVSSDQRTGKVSSDQTTNKVSFTDNNAATNPKQASTMGSSDRVPTLAITKRKVSFDVSFGSDHSGTDLHTTGTGDDLDIPAPKELLVTTSPPNVDPRGLDTISLERRVVGGVHTRTGGKENTWFALSSHLE